VFVEERPKVVGDDVVVSVTFDVWLGFFDDLDFIGTIATENTNIR